VLLSWRSTSRFLSENGTATILLFIARIEDVRAYRETRLTAAGKRGLFPLWGRDTGALAHEFVAAGFQAIIACRSLACRPIGREGKPATVAEIVGVFAEGR